MTCEERNTKKSVILDTLSQLVKVIHYLSVYYEYHFYFIFIFIFRKMNRTFIVLLCTNQ